MGAELRPGDVIGGKYAVERVLGRGGMGAVFAARHVQLGRRVALKLPARRGSPAMIARFLREARAAAGLDSDHVARVFDAGDDPEHGPHLVMELLAGQDLSALSREQGPLAQERAVDLVMQAGLGLAAAHAAGIVHRDLKPANLFLAERGDGTSVVKVLDFGISKLLGERAEREAEVGAAGAGTSLTQTGAVLGSPRYMSPEQLEGAADVDERSDLWALGVILHELLRGAPPFEGRSFAELRAQIATAPPPSIRLDRPELSADLEAVILRCLDKAPRRRFAHVGELLAALAPFGPSHAGAYATRAAHALANGGGGDTVPPSGAERTDPATGAPAGEESREPPLDNAPPRAAPDEVVIETSPPVSRTGPPDAVARQAASPALLRPRARAAIVGSAALVLVVAGAVGARLWPPAEGPGLAPSARAADESWGRERLDRANEARRAGDRENAQSVFQSLLTEAIDEGVTPGSPRAKVAAAAQLALAEMAAEALIAPPAATSLERAWEPTTTLDRQTFEATATFGSVLKWHDVAAVQCAVVGQARLHERHAEILSHLAVPPGSGGPHTTGPWSTDEAARGYAERVTAARERALELYRDASGRPVPRGEGCREDAKSGEERVARALAGRAPPSP